MLVEVGKIIEGKVSGITNFGAFIQLPDGKTGLVHISEVAEAYVKDIKEHLKENQVVKVKVLSEDHKGKLSLSIKKAQEPKPVYYTRRPVDVDWSRSANNEALSFEDHMSRFKKDSEERMRDLKKGVEAKRGGGGYRKSAHNY